MADEHDVLDFAKRSGYADLLAAAASPGADRAEDAAEASCPAYRYLRGTQERALAVEFRKRNGDREWFPYALLGPWRYNPSMGMMLKFTGGDVLTVVLIRGSNLDTLVNNAINLTDRGFQRHRILAVREMDEDELRAAGEGSPTVDRIDITEFDSAEELRAWLAKAAPVFMRPPM